jgi:hypothetical protein
MGRLRLAQHCTFAMARAAHALDQIGARTGLLPSPPTVAAAAPARMLRRKRQPSPTGA